MPELAAAIAIASLGAMLFFSAAIAPTVFKVLPEAHAGSFLRAVFPRYFLINGLASVVAGLLAVELVAATILLVSGAVMLGIRYVAIPVINKARDQMLTGAETAKTRFDTWHKGTVVLNVIEMLALSVAATILLV
ncbi:MAG: DUF4149 domain-containing protein [Hyphomicrobiaceae bacterium TMED74]|nr:hypothetical protein [Filomicrobium sp.]RPG42129.1 MAG: DUF4149 domain-containing protein [Hyphomicrobiaceae bacterium TMED74]